MNPQSKKILITFARSFLALELARQLDAAGHSVYMVDSVSCYVARFSNAIKKSFKVPSPRFNAEGYISSLVKIVEEQGIDFLL